MDTPNEELNTRLLEYAKMMKGKPAFVLLRPATGDYSIDTKYYRGKITRAEVQYPKININTDTGDSQWFDRSVEIVEDGIKMVCDKGGYSAWAILLKKPVDFSCILDCTYCSSVCKRSKPCQLNDSKVKMDWWE